MSSNVTALARGLTALGVIASLSIVATKAGAEVQSNVVRLGRFDAALWGEQLRRELNQADPLKPGQVFESAYGDQYPADRASGVIAARFRGGISNPPLVGFGFESELDTDVQRVAHVYGRDLPILEQPTFVAADLGVVGLAQDGDLYPVLEQKTVGAYIQNPLDRSPSLCGEWLRIQTRTGTAGWLLGAPCSLPAVVAVAQRSQLSAWPMNSSILKGGALPPHPVIFIHGIASNADAAWGEFRDLLVTGGWQFGGHPEVVSKTGLVGFVTPADFYTMNMLDWQVPDFPSQHHTFEEQGLQVSAVVQRVREANRANKVILVGHSMGGLAARAYLQSLGRNRYRDDVFMLITVGTPHLGTPLAAILADSLWGGAVSAALPIDSASTAVRELAPDSAAITKLNSLNGATGLPPRVRYLVIAARGEIAPLQVKLTGEGDGVVGVHSQLFLPGRRQHIAQRTFQIPYPERGGAFEPPCRKFEITVDGVRYLGGEVHRCETHFPPVLSEVLRNLRGASDLISQPPDEIIDRGACPYELCRYGERWLARSDVEAYAGPPAAFGASLGSLQRSAVIPRGAWITTVTGLVIAKKHEGRVDLVNRRTMYANGVTDAPPLVNGQVLPIYSYLGEDCYSTWIAGKTYPVCSLEPVTNSPDRPSQEWWVEVVAADGAKAWVGPANGRFISQEGLNGDLGQALADATTGLQAKLLKVEVLMREGADLNGGAGQYGISPVQGVIEAMDVALLKTMLSRGLDLRKPCPAATAAQHALEPAGASMLEILLANGLQLTCLYQPAFHLFLQTGLELNSYPVGRAIRVSELLFKNGASLAAPDFRGKSILEVLDDPTWAARVVKLKQALLAMAKGRN